VNKTKILLLPFLIGLGLVIYSWFLTYPLSITNASDNIFNHVSIFYWIGLPLLMASMLLMAATTKNVYLKWVLSTGIVLAFYSLSYFFGLLPGVDTQYFRGLSEYFFKTNSLDASQLNHDYYQWPAFFILAKVVTSISGLSLEDFQFLLFTVIGFLLSTGIYVYASRKYKYGGFLAVVTFFLSIYYFFNYQGVPFSLALGLLFVMLMLDTRQKSASSTITLLLLYTGLLFMHLFVPVFFIIYLLLRGFLDKSRYYWSLFLITLNSYVLYSITMAKFTIAQIFALLIAMPTTYGDMIKITIQPVLAPFDVTAQLFSRTVTIGFILLGVVCFTFMFIKRKLSTQDKALLITGIFYSGLGVVLNTLGWRAISIVFIPVCLSAAYMFESKFRRYSVFAILVLVILSVFIPIHQSFSGNDQFQTREDYVAENFLLTHCNLEQHNFVFTDYWASWYVESELSTYKYIYTDPGTANQADVLLITPPLIGQDLGNNNTLESVVQKETLNVVYNDGSSYVLIKSHS